MAEVGRKTDLTPELIKKIREAIVAGNDLKTTANICEIDPQKLYNWNCDNYLNLNDKIRTWKLESKLLRAENRADEILSLPIIEDGKVNTGIVSIVQKESQFIRETLDRKSYSKQLNTDITSDGKPLPILNLTNVQSDNSNTEDNIPKEED